MKDVDWDFVISLLTLGVFLSGLAITGAVVFAIVKWMA